VDCATAGVFGPVTALIGALMAADARRLLAGDEGAVGTVASYDGLRGAFRASRFAPRASCPLCGARTIRDLRAARYASPECAA
jgi:molybdopterin/thiamine biosynthesis adenylyltransferase